MLEFPGGNAKLLCKREEACTKREIRLDGIRWWRATLSQDGNVYITVEDRPALLRLDVPPDTLKEMNSGWLEMGSLDLLRSDEPFQKANERLHALLRFASLIGDVDHQAEEVCKGLFIWYALNELIEKQPSGHPS